MLNGTPKLLILEDNDDDFAIIQLALKKYGRTVQLLHYSQASTLINDLQHNLLIPPRLTLVDLRMLGKGGYEVLVNMRASKIYHLCPVVVLSTTANPLEIKKCYEAGINAFHEKKLETTDMINELVSIFHYWLGLVRLPNQERLDKNER